MSIWAKVRKSPRGRSAPSPSPKSRRAQFRLSPSTPFDPFDPFDPSDPFDPFDPQGTPVTRTGPENGRFPPLRSGSYIAWVSAHPRSPAGLRSGAPRHAASWAPIPRKNRSAPCPNAGLPKAHTSPKTRTLEPSESTRYTKPRKSMYRLDGARDSPAADPLCPNEPTKVPSSLKM